MKNPTRRSSRAFLGVEQLEARSVPATLVNATTLTYEDVDGDTVTVKLSKPLLTAGNADSVFAFDTGKVNGDNFKKQQLQHIDLTSFASGGNGTGISVTAVRGASGGDALANVGQISGWDLGDVVVHGDLEAIDAGDSNTKTTALASLTVQSMGRLGTSTGSATEQSDFMGPVGSITVKSDIVGVFLQAFGAGAGDDAHGRIGKITVGGSLFGNGTGGGSITSTGDMGPVTIAGDVVGDSGGGSGRIFCGGKLANVTIGGSLIGVGFNSGGVVSTGAMGPVTIGGDIRGGAGTESGEIRSTAGAIAKVTVGGSVIGGAGAGTPTTLQDDGRNPIYIGAGSIVSYLDMGPVVIGDSLVGGPGNDSGIIVSLNGSIQGAAAVVTIGGSLVGGGGLESGFIFSHGEMGRVKIAADVRGGAGDDSGGIQTFAGKLGGLTLGGSVIGGSGGFSGCILNFGPLLGAVSIAGDIRGGGGGLSGIVLSIGQIASVFVGGSLIGGNSAGSTVFNGNEDQFFSTGNIASRGDIGRVVIGGSLVGSSDVGSGSILSSGGKIQGVNIGGSLWGGSGKQSGRIFSFDDAGIVKVTGDLRGGDGESSGIISDGAKMAGATIGGSVLGGKGPSSGQVFSMLDMGTISIVGDVRGGVGESSGGISSAGKLAGVTIGGSLVGGGKLSGNINAPNIGNIKIAGSIRGGDGSNSGRIFTPGTLASVTIGGSVIGALKDGTGEIQSNGDMGAVKIGADLVGGNAPTNGSVEGNGFVQGKRIASVYIGGSVRAGTNDNADPVTYFLKRNGTIRAANDIGAITIKGNLIGSRSEVTGFVNPVLITARGQAVQTMTDVAVASLTVFGRVERTSILAGYDVDLNPVNGDAQIGAVVVNGDWIASNLVAGVEPGGDEVYGTADDTLIPGSSAGIVSKIASIKILGQVQGTLDSIDNADHYGFVAEQIGTFNVAGATIPLKAGPRNDDILLGVTNDTELREMIVV
jgi:hypothetical protein